MYVIFFVFVVVQQVSSVPSNINSMTGALQHRQCLYPVLGAMEETPVSFIAQGYYALLRGLS